MVSRGGAPVAAFHDGAPEIGQFFRRFFGKAQILGTQAKMDRLAGQELFIGSGQHPPVENLHFQPVAAFAAYHPAGKEIDIADETSDIEVGRILVDLARGYRPGRFGRPA